MLKRVNYHGEYYLYPEEYQDTIDKWLADEDYVWSELKKNLETYDWCTVPEIETEDRVLFDAIEGFCFRLIGDGFEEDEIIEELKNQEDYHLRSYIAGKIQKVINESEEGDIGWEEMKKDIEKALAKGDDLFNEHWRK